MVQYEGTISGESSRLGSKLLDCMTFLRIGNKPRRNWELFLFLCLFPFSQFIFSGALRVRICEIDGCLSRRWFR